MMGRVHNHDPLVASEGIRHRNGRHFSDLPPIPLGILGTSKHMAITMGRFVHFLRLAINKRRLV